MGCGERVRVWSVECGVSESVECECGVRVGCE